MSTHQDTPVAETAALPEHMPLDRPQNRRRSRRPAIQDKGYRDRTVKRALARALTPRAHKAVQFEAAQAIRREQWAEHFRLAGTVDRRGRPASFDEVHQAKWSPFYVDPATLVHFYSADVYHYGQRVITVNPAKCSDDQVADYERGALEIGLLTEEQFQDVDEAVTALGGAVSSARMRDLAAAAREDEDLQELIAGYFDEDVARAEGASDGR